MITDAFSPVSREIARHGGESKAMKQGRNAGLTGRTAGASKRRRRHSRKQADGMKKSAAAL